MQTNSDVVLARFVDHYSVSSQERTQILSTNETVFVFVNQVGEWLSSIINLSSRSFLHGRIADLFERLKHISFISFLKKL